MKTPHLIDWPPHFRVGHHADPHQKTGLTVLIPPGRALCAYHICGTVPASRELTILQESPSPLIDALLFSGGSAFGLGSANGVMNWLREQGRGTAIPLSNGNRVVIPIVPTVCIFDEGARAQQAPSPEAGYLACQQASSDPIALQSQIGEFGAGKGATINKWNQDSNGTLSRGGFGFAGQRFGKNAVITAFVVVNALGNVGRHIVHRHIGNIQPDHDPRLFAEAGGNTVLSAVVTNVNLSARELKIVAKMATAGLMRTISPACTPFDGDVVLAISTGQESGTAMGVGTLAADLLETAILRAVGSE